MVAASVDDVEKPEQALVHFFDGNEVRARFQRAYEARKAAGYSQPPGRGVWIHLYEQEQSEPPSKVGAGAGLKHHPIARIPLDNRAVGYVAQEAPVAGSLAQPEPHLTIPEAKRRLAAAFGVAPENVKITIEG